MTVFVAFAESIQLVPDGTLFLHIALIILMVFILNRVLFGPINRVLSERDRRTHGSSKEARGILRSVDENLARYEQTLRDTRAESYRMMEERRAEAMRERQQRLNSAREEVEHLIGREKELIKTQSSEARTELEAEARRVATNIRNHILGRQMGSAPREDARV